jgi:nitrogen regulatory protein PII 2
LGRGKKSIDPELLNAVLAAGELPLTPMGENIMEATRLIAKRFFTFIVEDGDVEKAVETVISVNQTGNPGDGKIFILPILGSYTVSSGESTLEAY